MSALHDREVEAAACLGLLHLHGMGPRRARWLVGSQEAKAAWSSLRSVGRIVGLPDAPAGVDDALVERWRRQARSIDTADLLDRHRRAGVHLLLPDDPGWPFTHDPDPPLMLFGRGRWHALEPAVALVAVVGTRRCTSAGRRIAHGLGRDLAEAGIGVVSGLALGIDGAAHIGALGDPEKVATPPGAMPIAVVATGLDRVYPPGNRELWHQVAERGLLLSESPLGVGPQRWRFPARNRLIAAIASLIVVVESHRRGGALLTVDEAAERGKPVAVVPGSVLSAASEGTNALLRDGCAPVCSVTDVLELLGLDTSGAAQPAAPGERTVSGGSAAGVDELGRRVLEQLGGDDVHLDQLVAATGADLHRLLPALDVLVSLGLATLDGNRVSYGGRS
jgi:DNA processing protein